MIKDNNRLKNKIILGIDVGTSGLRACVVKKELDAHQTDHKILIECSVKLEPAKNNDSTGQVLQDPFLWLDALDNLLIELKSRFDLLQITHLIIDATSSTVLLSNNLGKPLTKALMYNDNHAKQPALQIEKAYQKYQKTMNQSEVLQDSSQVALGASSTLAKVLSLLESNQQATNPIICHQADFINTYLCGSLNITDENNALKLGYDLINEAWPVWVTDLLAKYSPTCELPMVVKPGSYLGEITPQISSKYGFNSKLRVMAGTTDSIAGFLASGANQLGDTVTSLGSTIAIKALSEKPIYNAKYGLYSHRLNNFWLVGGASNAGGQVLLNYYSLDQLKWLNNQITEADINTFLKSEPENYYPLSSVGERFPISNSQLKPKLPDLPICNSDEITLSSECLEAHKQFLLKLLYGLTLIEKQSYQRLSEMGCEHIKDIYSVGGGTQSKIWMALRQQQIKSVQFLSAKQLQAAFGVTRLIS